MIHRGDCLSCRRVGTCSETNEEKVKNSFTCQLFEGVLEAEYLARIDTMKKYGEHQAVRALLNRPEEPREERDE